jgi:hypothetical protein
MALGIYIFNKTLTNSEKARILYTYRNIELGKDVEEEEN